MVNDKFLNQKKFIKNTSPEEIKYLTDLYDNYIKDCKPNIEIPKSDIDKENFLLNSLNLQKFKYVCFHNRDESFLYKNSINQNWSHHSFRNSNIENYIDLASYINEKKLKSIRVGKETEIKLNHKFIYDYTNSKFQNDFADICIIKKLLFFVFIL